MSARIVTFGEIMLRLKAPGHERLFQSPVLETVFGGGEANVSVSLANFGMDTRFVSVLPDNAVGDACLRELRGFGVDVSAVCRQAGRMGIYFIETGAMQRPSKVVYDRADSTMARAKVGDIDWQAALAGASWFHFSGITPAISQSAAELTHQAVRAAKAMGLHVSCDVNYRGSLWQWGKSAEEVMTSLMPYVDTVIANEGHFQLVLGVHTSADHKVADGTRTPEEYAAIAEETRRLYPNISRVAMTVRQCHTADHNDWRAVLYEDGELVASPCYAMEDIVDRVGGGDSFTAGLIYGLHHYASRQDALDFAVAASCLKHSIPGDFNRVTAQEVEALMGGSVSGRVQR